MSTNHGEALSSSHGGVMQSSPYQNLPFSNELDTSANQIAALLADHSDSVQSATNIYTAEPTTANYSVSSDLESANQNEEQALDNSTGAGNK